MNSFDQPAMAKSFTPSQARPTEAVQVTPWISKEETVGLGAALLGGIVSVTSTGVELANSTIAKTHTNELHARVVNEVVPHILQVGGLISLATGLGLLIDSYRKRNQDPNNRADRSFWVQVR